MIMMMMRNYKVLFLRSLVMFAGFASAGTAATTLYAVVGQSVILPCLTSVNQPVDWRFRRSPTETVIEICRAGKVINGFFDRFLLVSDNRSSHSLTLRKALINDSGIYTCVEESGIGKEHQIRLVVSEADAVLTVTAGQRVNLQCITPNGTTVDWRFRRSPNDEVFEICRHNTVINGYPERFSSTTDSSERNHSLILHEARSNDTGVYTCVEEAGIGESHPIELKVTGHLIFSGVTLVSVDSLVVLRCSIKNTLVFRWHVEHAAGTLETIFNGRKLSEKYPEKFQVRHERNRSYLIIQSVQRSDQGIYTCSPVHSAGISEKFQIFLPAYVSTAKVSTDAAIQTASTSANKLDDESRSVKLVWLVGLAVPIGFPVSAVVFIAILILLKGNHRSANFGHTNDLLLRPLNPQRELGNGDGYRSRLAASYVPI